MADGTKLGAEDSCCYGWFLRVVTCRLDEDGNRNAPTFKQNTEAWSTFTRRRVQYLTGYNVGKVVGIHGRVFFHICLHVIVLGLPGISGQTKLDVGYRTQLDPRMTR